MPKIQSKSSLADLEITERIRVEKTFSRGKNLMNVNICNCYVLKLFPKH